MPTFEERLAKSTSRKVVLIQMEVRSRITGWAEYTDSTVDMWAASCPYYVTELLEDGVSLTECASLSALELADTSSAAAYFWSRDPNAPENGMLYLKTVGETESPHDHVLTAQVCFFFSEHARDDGGFSYEPRLTGIPSLTLAVQERFDSDAPAFGAGGFSLANQDGYFDDLTDIEWDGTVSLLLAVDLPGTVWDVMETAEAIGSWRIDRVSYDDEFKIQVSDLRKQIKGKIASKKFISGTLDESNFTYPSLGDGVEGKVVPVAFGSVRGALAFLINTTTKTFKVAGHAITSFDSFQTDEGVTFNPDSYDVSKAEFVYSAYDLEDEKGIWVDFTAPDDNPVDVIEELLTSSTRGLGLSSASLHQYSSTDESYTGFGSGGARDFYVRGQTSGGTERTLFAIGLYIKKETDPFKLIGLLGQTAFLYTYQTTGGLYTCRPWDCRPGEQVELELQDEEIFDLEVQDDFRQVLTRVTVTFDEHHGSGETQVVVKESDEWETLRGLTTAAEDSFELPLSEPRDARLWASRALAMYRRPVRTMKLATVQKALMLLPGHQIRVDYGVRGLVGLFEVLEINTNPGSFAVNLVLSDLHGFRERSGFWTSDTPTFPVNIGGGSAATWDGGSAAWTDEERQYAKENFGYWTHDNEMNNDPPDADSFKGSVWV